MSRASSGCCRQQARHISPLRRGRATSSASARCDVARCAAFMLSDDMTSARVIRHAAPLIARRCRAAMRFCAPASAVTCWQYRLRCCADNMSRARDAFMRRSERPRRQRYALRAAMFALRRYALCAMMDATHVALREALLFIEQRAIERRCAALMLGRCLPRRQPVTPRCLLRR